MKKILYVATVVKTHLMEFHIPYLQMLKEEGWHTEAAAKNDYENPEDCKIPFCDVYYDLPFDRNPFKASNIKAYKQLKQIIEDGQFDIVHCHTPVGAMVTRLAAAKARKNGTKVIYTAHGFHFFKGAPLINWLLYYPVEKTLSRLTDVLVTINREDYARAKTFKAKRVEYIPGIGVNISAFAKRASSDNTLRKELGIPEGYKVLLSVGEVNYNKNHKAVIEVLPELEKCIYVVCGSGPLIEEHRQLAQKLGVADRLIMAGYRTDVAEFYRMADIFVFPSLREGLPVAVMEAMAAELPCVAAKNRGTNDLLSESRLRFDPHDRKELKEKLMIALNEDCTDEIDRNSETLKDFSIEHTKQLVKDIYARCLGS